MTPDVTIVIADDQAMVRAGFRSLLESEPGISVVGEAADGQAAITQCVALKPHVVLMDIRMPGTDGIAATKEVAARTATKVLVLTTFDLDEYVFAALRAGASGFLLKDAPVQDLVAAIRAIADGGALLDAQVTRRVIETFASAPSPREDLQRARWQLTEREDEVLQLLARGLTNSEIASSLHIGEATAKTHVSNVLAKLGLRDRVHAVIFAYEAGVVVQGGQHPRTWPVAHDVRRP